MSYQRSYDFSQSEDNLPIIPTILDITSHASDHVDFLSYRGWVRHILLIEFGGILTVEEFDSFSKRSDIIPKWEAEWSSPHPIEFTQEEIPIFPIQIDVELDQSLLCHPRTPVQHILSPMVKNILPVIRESKRR